MSSSGGSSSGGTSTLAAPTINSQTGTAYTPVIGDGNNVLVTLANAAAITVTIPPNSAVAFPAGTTLQFKQAGAGAVTVNPGAGVTLGPSTASTAGIGQELWVTKMPGTDTWEVVQIGGSGSSTPVLSQAMVAPAGSPYSLTPTADNADNWLGTNATAALVGSKFAYLAETINDGKAANGQATESIKCLVAGIVDFEMSGFWTAGSAMSKTLWLYKNGARLIVGPSVYNAPFNAKTTKVTVAVNDVFRLYVQHNGTSAIQSYGIAGGDTYLRATYLGVGG